MISTGRITRSTEDPKLAGGRPRPSEPLAADRAQSLQVYVPERPNHWLRVELRRKKEQDIGIELR